MISFYHSCFFFNWNTKSHSIQWKDIFVVRFIKNSHVTPEHGNIQDMTPEWRMYCLLKYDIYIYDVKIGVPFTLYFEMYLYQLFNILKLVNRCFLSFTAFWLNIYWYSSFLWAFGCSKQCSPPTSVYYF